MEIAVVGAGNGGCTAAADLTRREFGVRLCSRSAATLAQNRGGLEYTDVMGEGFAPITVVTTDLARAIDGTDVVMLVASIARTLAAHGIEDPVVCGTSTLPYAARIVAAATVRISLDVRRLFVAAFPGARTEEYYPRITAPYPSATPAGDSIVDAFAYQAGYLTLPAKARLSVEVNEAKLQIHGTDRTPSTRHTGDGTG